MARAAASCRIISRFIYQVDDDSYRSPNQQSLTPRHASNGGKSGRTLKRYASDDQKDALRLKMSQPEQAPALPAAAGDGGTGFQPVRGPARFKPRKIS